MNQQKPTDRLSAPLAQSDVVFAGSTLIAVPLQAHRHTGSYLYHCAKGSGHSIINGKRYDWAERDIFCVPSWAWHEHVNASVTDDACLFCLNDLPVMRALGLYREEALGKKAEKVLLPLQPGDVEDTFADCSSLQTAVDYRPSTSLKQGIQEFVNWYRQYYA